MSGVYFERFRLDSVNNFRLTKNLFGDFSLSHAVIWMADNEHGRSAAVQNRGTSSLSMAQTDEWNCLLCSRQLEAFIFHTRLLYGQTRTGLGRRNV